MEKDRRPDPAKRYANISSKHPLAPLLSKPLFVIGVHWLFQGLLYMDRSERAFKLSTDAVVTLTLFIGLRLYIPWSAALAFSFFCAHSLNFIFNGHIWGALKQFGVGSQSQDAFRLYLHELAGRIGDEPAILFAAAYGSVARGERQDQSDLDIRLVRAPGFFHAVRAVSFVMWERSRALIKRFPLDIYVFDRWEGLGKLNHLEMPVVLHRAPPNQIDPDFGRKFETRLLANILWSVRDSLFANAGYLIGVQLLNSVSGFLYWAVVARQFAASEIGTASAVLAAVALSANLSNLGLGTGLVRFLPASHAPHRMLNTTLVFSLLSSLVVSAAFLLGLPLWSPELTYLTESGLKMFSFAEFAAASTMLSVLSMAFLARRKAVFGLVGAVSANVSRLGLVFLFIDHGVTGIVAPVAIGTTLSVLLGLLLFVPNSERDYRFRFRFSMTDLRLVLPYSIGNYVSGFFIQLPHRILPLLTLALIGSVNAGYAQIAWMVGYFLASPGIALASSAFAEGANSPADLRQILKKAASGGILATLLPSIFVAAAAPTVLGWFGEDFAHEAAAMLRWMAAAAPFAFVTSLYFTFLRLRKRVGRLVLLGGFLAAVVLGTSASLLPLLGVVANGIGWLMANLGVTVAAIWDLWSKRKHSANSDMQLAAELDDTFVPSRNNSDNKKASKHGSYGKQ